jgi:hypothetical protein
MGSCRLAEMRLEVAERVKPLTLPERVEALERRVAEIESTRAVEGELLSREACRTQAAARENLRQRYAAAAPERLEHLREFAAECMVTHTLVGCVAAPVKVEYSAWLVKHGLGSATAHYETAEEVEAALLELFPDATRENVLNEASYPVPGLRGVALIPEGQTAVTFVASIEAARAAEQQRRERGEALDRDRIELARTQARLAKDAEQAREDQRLANAYMAEQYRAAHPELEQRPNPGGPMEQELERRQAAAPA